MSSPEKPNAGGRRGGAPPPDLSRLQGAALALCVAAVGAFWATWPLVRRLGEATIGKVDAWPSAWQINWLHRSLLTDPLGWAAANIFFPYENSLATSDLLLTPALITVPAAFFESVVLAYNVALLGGIALCGLTGFLLIEELTSSRWAALLGSTMLALNPFRFLHIEHLSIIAAWPPVLLCWALLRFFRTPSAARGWIVALSGVLVAGASLYQALYLAPFLPLVVAVAAARGRRDRRTWLTLAGPCLAAAPVIAVLAYPYWEGMQVRGVPWSPNDLRRFAADVTSLAAPPPFMDDPAAASTLNPEARLYPGMALSLLLVVAVVSIVARSWARPRPARVMSGASVALAAALGLGLQLGTNHSLRRPWELLVVAAVWLLPPALAFWAVFEARRSTTADGAAAGARLVAAIAFGLAGTAWALALSFGPTLHLRGEAIGAAPYGLLVALSSVFEGTRVPARFGGFVVIFMSIAAAAGLALAARMLTAFRRVSTRPAQPAVAAVLSVIVFAGVAVDLPREPWGFEVVPATDLPAYDWLAAIPGDFGILELPDDGHLVWERSFYMLATRRHGKRIVNGTAGQTPALHEKYYDVVPWTDEFFVFIRSYLPVRFVLVREPEVPAEVRTELLPRLALGQEGWRRAFQGRELWVFEVDRSNERGAFVERLYLRRDLAPMARLTFDTRVVGASRPGGSLELLRDGERIATWPVGVEWRRITVDVPLEFTTPIAENAWPRTTVLFRWQLAASTGGELELSGIDVGRAAR